MKACEWSYPSEKRLAACTRIIQRKGEPVSERVKALVQRAWTHYYREDFLRMNADFAEAVRLAPEEINTYTTRAYLNRERGDLDSAIADYTTVIRLRNWASYYATRAQIHRQKGDEASALADYNEALRLYEEDFKKHPETPSYYGRSEVHLALGKFEEALSDLDAFLKTQKEWNEYFAMMRGDILFNSGDIDRAINEYSDVIRRKPEQENAYFRRALAYRAKGDNARAITDYDKILSLERDSPDAFSGRGLTHAASGRLDAAVRDFTRAIELNDEDALARYNRAQAYRLMGRFDEALRDYGMAIGIDPKNAAIFNSRSHAYLAVGDRERALADLDEAIRLDERFATAWFNRGAIRQAAKQFDLAIADYTAAAAADPARGDYYAARAGALAAQGTLERALADFTEALRREPLNAVFYAARAAVQVRLDRRDAALDDVNRALLLNRDLATAWSVRADIYRALGKTNLADADRKAAAEARARLQALGKSQVAAAKGVLSSHERAPSSARIVINGSFLIDGGDGLQRSLSDLVVEVKGAEINYRRSDFLDITARPGSLGTATFRVRCNNVLTDTMGERTLSATITGRQIELKYTSRFDFTRGPCRGMYNYRDEIISINASDEGCRFSYAEQTTVKNAGRPVSENFKVSSQRCAIERFEP